MGDGAWNKHLILMFPPSSSLKPLPYFLLAGWGSPCYTLYFFFDNSPLMDKTTTTEISLRCDRLLPDWPSLTSLSGMYTSECGVCADKSATEERALQGYRVKKCLSGGTCVAAEKLHYRGKSPETKETRLRLPLVFIKCLFDKALLYSFWFLW